MLPARLMMTAAALLLVGGAATPAAAQESSRRPSADAIREERENHYRKWLSQDVFYIITEQEKEVFLKLSSDEERDVFIEQFWRRRDPDPRTEINEFKEEHYRRIAYANERFHSGEPGWRTDRGEIYIKFGPPDGLETHPAGGPYARRLDEGGGTTDVYPFERWRYNYIEGIGPNVEIEFVDPSRTGEYRLALSPQDKDALLFVQTTYAGKTEPEQLGIEDRWLRVTRDYGLGIQARSGFYSIHPDDFPFEKLRRVADLQSAPVTPEARALKEDVRTRITYDPLPLQATHSYVLLSPDRYFVPITVEIENRWLTYQAEDRSYRAEVRVYGLVSDLAGRVWLEFDELLNNRCRADELERELQRRSLFQKRVQLPPGRYKIEIYVGDAGGRFGVYQDSLILPEANQDELVLSPIVLADLAEADESGSEGFEQFLLGALKVVPNVARSFLKGDDLHIYLQAYGVKLDQTTLEPSLSVSYFLMKDARVVDAFPDLEGKSIEYVSPQRVVLLTGFRLRRLEPGQYRVVVQVQDRISGRECRAETAFRLEEKS